jgi:hypothetical protein
MDNYTRTLVTIIAVCLIWLCLRQMIQIAPTGELPSGRHIGFTAMPYATM